MRATLALALLVALSGCRELSRREGFPCSTTGSCPSPYACYSGFCYRSPPDGSVGDGEGEGDLSDGLDTRDTTDASDTRDAADAPESDLLDARDASDAIVRDASEDGSCGTGFKRCGAVCIPEGTCCGSSDCVNVCETCPGPGQTCAPVKNADDADSCSGTCDGNGACKTKKGQVCQTTSGGCVAGTTCSPEGYCCDRACTGSCEACDVSGSVGTCTAISTTPRTGHPACAGGGTPCAGSCTSRPDGQCTYPTVTCGQETPMCSGADAVGQSTCENGSCKPPTAKVCPNNFACSGSASPPFTCPTMCFTAMDCRSGYFCSGQTCHLRAVQVEAGGAHTCAVLSDGTVRCWGDNTNGQLGSGSTASSSVVPVVVSNLTGVMSVSAGDRHTCALRTNGAVSCWGEANALGSGASTDARVPVAVTGLSSGASMVSAGVGYSCALVSGAVRCWGSNTFGQLGDGTETPAATPVNVSNLSAATTIAAGKDHTCAISSGNVYCWGRNNYGQLGNGVITDHSATRVQMTAGFTAVTVAPGAEYTCAANGNSLFCWGRNDHGQLGVFPDPPSSLMPLIVGGPPAPTALASGLAHSCALGNNQVVCWGDNTSSQVIGSTSTSSPPFILGSIGSAISVSAGSSHTCVATAEGSVLCWGNGGAGRLGFAPPSGYAMTPTPVTLW